VSQDLGPWVPLGLGAACTLLGPAPFPWWLAGGHALDLFVGHQTRAHADLDISLLRSDAPRLRAFLAGWDLHLAHDGVLTPWLEPEVAPPVNSAWCRTRPTEPWCLQAMFEEGTSTEWICRRHPEIRVPWSEAILRSAEGTPYLAPQLQLLMKAKDTRPKDDADFAAVFPRLAPAEARWLTTLVQRYYPHHHWTSP
jgi:hypothetical protein